MATTEQPPRVRPDVWFTADTHFGHGGALGLFRRPYPSVAAMDGALIQNWNKTVAPGDTVWHLGDFAVRVAPERAAGLLYRLHGVKHLVGGNNDPPAIRALSGWASVQDYAELELDGRRLVLCHYPLRAWKGQHRGTLQLHGHSHGRLKPLPRQIDVGVDAQGFRPVALEALPARRSRSATGPE
jgi:calcineurin-like phosphoesterase family protein